MPPAPLNAGPPPLSSSSASPARVLLPPIVDVLLVPFPAVAPPSCIGSSAQPLAAKSYLFVSAGPIPPLAIPSLRAHVLAPQASGIGPDALLANARSSLQLGTDALLSTAE